jgi:chloramphenicol 3-O-phosphotransferase
LSGDLDDSKRPVTNESALDQNEEVLVVLISGPIASGKSALGRAVAGRLDEAAGSCCAVIDLDLVYEMLDPRQRPKSDEHLWAVARRVAGGMVGVLLREGRSVVVEGGDFFTEEQLAEFEHQLPEGVAVRLVRLDVDPETALRRARADDSRGVSTDPGFMSRHYAEFRTDWGDRDVLKLDTGTASLAETARSIVDWLTFAR